MRADKRPRPEMFFGLFDDASQFPPGNLPLDDALTAHSAWQRDPRRAFVGRFLLPMSREDAFRTARLQWQSGPLSLSLIAQGTSWSEGCLLAAEVAARLHVPSSGVLVRAVELPLPDAFKARDLVTISMHTPALEVYVEPLAHEVEDVLPRIADAGARAKLRCGGLEASAFPSVEHVAAFIGTCARLELPFKATAGLHDPLAHYDTTLGVRRHGFLNLWAATACALEAPTDPGRVRACLELEDPGSILVGEHAVRFGEVDLRMTALERARHIFTAFGTCSISEPLDGLESMGWLEAPTMDA